MAADHHLLFLFILLLSAARVSASIPAKPQSADLKSTQFIRTCCAKTLYPKLCYFSLANYSNTIKTDHTQLATVAANVSLSRIRTVAAHVATIRRSAFSAAAGSKSPPSSSIDPHTASALRDCAESLSDAEDLTRQSAQELEQLGTAVGAEVAWHVSNAQTWMSAALTNEDTCTDGFSTSSASPFATGAAAATTTTPVKADVTARVRRAKQYTSNALALVNSLVAGNP